MSIFRDNAPLYWAAGIPVMPLKSWNSPAKGRGKAPILNEWTQYGNVMPSEAIRATWLETYPDSNIGLPFGPASNLCAIDIDTEDPDIDEAIRSVLPGYPNFPWERVGRKGVGLIFKWQGQPNFKLRNDKNESIVEFLGQGNQLVLPPSIHPDTEKPYITKGDVHLWDVLDQIPALPSDIEQRLRTALEPILGKKGFTLAQAGRSSPLDIVPQGERDIQMVRHAGYLARVVRGIDKNEKLTLAAAMEHMSTWVTDFTASSAGDDMDPAKGVAKLLEFLIKDLEAGKTLPGGWDAGLTPVQREHPAIAAMIEKNEVQRWTYEKAEDWLTAQIEIDPTSKNWVVEKLMEIVSLVAKDENFSDFEFNMLSDRIRGLMPKGVKVSKPDLKAAFKVARQDDVESAADHEAIARQVFEELSRAGEIKHAQGRFWQWTGSCFTLIEDIEIQKTIAESIKGNALARRQNDYQALVKTVAMVARGELVQEMEIGINFANGFLDQDLKLQDHSPKFGKTFTMPFNYIPERAGEAHKWLEYLEMSWGDDPDYTEKVMALQEAFAATMFGIAPRFQRAILLHGKPRTGKTQALEVLKSMMPPASRCSVPPTLWNERFQLSAMIGKTLNVCGELPEEATIDGRAFKEVVEGTSQHTEFKGKDSFEFDPLAAHWFASNHLPRSRDTSGGFVRRWLLLDFNRVVTDVERVINFHEVLIAEEREAIAAWAVQGLQRLLVQRDYTLPPSHWVRVNQVLRANNSVAAFLQSNEKIRPSTEPGADADVRTAFDQYIWYMKDVSRGYGVTFERFMHMLNELGHECTPHHDKLGVLRYRAAGLKVIAPELPK
jgi:putative DNA primase/helicase